MVRPIQWCAHYKDGSLLHQYEDDTENMFSDINEDELMSFSVHLPGKEFAVDLEDGLFYLNGQWIEFENFSKEGPYRLIYFVRTLRHLSSLGSGMKTTSVERFPCVGLRARIDNSEVKKIIKISPYGDEVTFISQ